jgi:hypothetical protein
MATNSPWSVKGVDPEAREAAKIAARKQGVNVGRWLSNAILAAASEELRSKRPDSDQRYSDQDQDTRGPREVRRASRDMTMHRARTTRRAARRH